jgi:hypothetical protein
MKQAKPVDLQYTKRYGAFVAQHSIQDFYDLVVELVTNSDDSYHGVFCDGYAPRDGGPIVLEVEPHRGKTPSVVTVRDRAGGFRDVVKKLKEVGARTSREGDRGFMARGLKDCAALGHVTVETIVDGRYHKAEITTGFQLIEYISGGKRTGERATALHRKRLGMKKNGTVVRVELNENVTVPRLETIKRDFVSHFALRDVMSGDSGSTLKLLYGNSRLEPLNYSDPAADLVHDREYAVPGYENARFRFRLWKARKSIHNPMDPRCRRTGILVQGSRAIHGLSFLASELEGDPAADFFFGRIQCQTIDQLANEFSQRVEDSNPHPKDNPMLVIDPNRRDGLQSTHPFTRALYQQPIQVLKEEFRKHKNEVRQRRTQVEAKQTTDRLRKLAREATKFMREKLEETDSLGAGNPAHDRNLIKSGIALTPAYTQIELGTTKNFTVRVARKLGLPVGTEVRVQPSKAAGQAIELVGKPLDLEPDPAHEDFLRGTFSIRGTKLSGTVQIGCQVDGLDTLFAEVKVVDPAPVDLEIPNDFAFHRKSYTVRPGGRKKLFVRARFDRPIVEAPPVKITIDDTSTVVLRKATKLELVPGTTYYECSVLVEGKPTEGKAQIKAEMEGRSSTARISVVRREEEGPELTFKLVPESLGSAFRASWDRENPNRLLITTTHESIRRYLGKAEDGYPGQHSEAFRVLLAELIADNVCRRIVQEQARTIPMDVDQTYRSHNSLVLEFTPIAHKIQLASPT